MSTGKSKKIEALVKILLVVGVVLFINIIGNYFYTSLDLTEEKRFTLTPATKKMLGDLKGEIFVRVFLEGEFPAGFQRLSDATKEMLTDFRSESSKVNFIFDNPNDGTTEEVNAIRENLAEVGIVPSSLKVKDADQTKEMLFYPWALINYGERKIAVNLLESNGLGRLDEIVLNNSVSLLEYNLANSIQKLVSSSRPLIAFTQGQGELNERATEDIRRTLSPFYETTLVDLDTTTQVPEEVGVLVVAKPRGPFSDQDKFKIDQYVMNGGKVMWMIDKLGVSLDSLQKRKNFIPVDYNLQLDDLLFKYGIRLQPNVVLDLDCTRIPLVTGQLGSGNQYELFPWFYHPLVVPRSKHPIVKSLDMVNLFFPGTIDIVKTKTDVKSTVLLTSSERSRVQFSPVRLDFEIMRYEPDPSKFNKGNQPFAVLLEGEFPSLYENRVTREMADGLAKLGQTFKGKSDETKMIVVSDGDLAGNFYDPNSKKFQPVGTNIYEKHVFGGNKDFLINSIEYLLDSNGVIEARGKEVKLRLLDEVRAVEERGKWQLINIVLPLLFLILFGFGFNYYRRRKYQNPG